MPTLLEIQDIAGEDDYRNRIESALLRVARDVLDDPFAALSRGSALDSLNAVHRKLARKRRQLALLVIVSSPEYARVAVRAILGGFGGLASKDDVVNETDVQIKNKVEQVWDYIAELDSRVLDDRGDGIDINV